MELDKISRLRFLCVETQPVKHLKSHSDTFNNESLSLNLTM